LVAAFEPIGPFALRRVDQLAAVFVIGFLLGGARTRVASWVCLPLLLGLAAYWAMRGGFVVAGLALLVALLIYLIGPLLRSTKFHQGIVISSCDEGIVVETGMARTIYKWATLGRSRFAAGRLFVMIADNVALVIPEAATPRPNLEALASLIEARRTTAD